MARIVFDVTTNAVSAELYVLVRGAALPLTLDHGKATADLPEGCHALVWKFDGPPHARLTARATQAGLTLFEKTSRIAPCSLAGADTERFSVKGRERMRALKQDRSAEVISLHPPVTTVTAKLRRGALASGDFAAAE